MLMFFLDSRVETASVVWQDGKRCRTVSYCQRGRGLVNFFFSVHHLKCGPLTCIPPYITKVRGSALGCHFISPHTLSVCLSSVPCRTQTLEISTCVSLSVVRNTNTLRRVAVSRGSWWSPDSRSTLATWRATNPRGATRTWGSCSWLAWWSWKKGRRKKLNERALETRRWLEIRTCFKWKWWG